MTMLVTQYFKTVKLTIMEAAMVDSALAAHSDKLAAMLNCSGLPAISVRNMQIEWDATQQALIKLAHTQAAA